MLLCQTVMLLCQKGGVSVGVARKIDGGAGAADSCRGRGQLHRAGEKGSISGALLRGCLGYIEMQNGLGDFVSFESLQLRHRTTTSNVQ